MMIHPHGTEGWISMSNSLEINIGILLNYFAIYPIFKFFPATQNLTEVDLYYIINVIGGELWRRGEKIRSIRVLELEMRVGSLHDNVSKKIISDWQ